MWTETPVTSPLSATTHLPDHTAVHTVDSSWCCLHATTVRAVRTIEIKSTEKSAQQKRRARRLQEPRSREGPGSGYPHFPGYGRSLDSDAPDFSLTITAIFHAAEKPKRTARAD